MKKVLQLIIAVVLAATSIESKAQLVNGSIAPDFTFTDIAGHTQHLYDTLDAGKTVYINVSTAWSLSSWTYHHTGDLDSLFKYHGPHGTNDVRVLFIEADISNDSIQLYGISSSQTSSGLSQGNFVAGTLFPIIDFDSATAGAAAFLSSAGYNIQYYPTIYMICPDRFVTLVGEASTANLYAAKSVCDTSIALVDAEMMVTSSYNGALASCDSVIPTFRIGNLGTSPLTSAIITLNVDGTAQKIINWTGNLPLYGNSLITGVKVGAAPGIHTITAVVSKPNGITTDPTAANDTATANFTIYRSVGGGLVSQNFDTTGIPSSWIINKGGVSYTWENANHGYNSPASAKLPWYFIPAGDVDMFTIDDMSFVGVNPPGLSFDVAYASFSVTNLDKLEVQASVDCGSTWATYYSKFGTGLATHPPVTSEFVPASAADWRQESVYLFSLVGEQSVLVRFKGTSDYGNDIYIDNINVIPSLGINEIQNIASVNIYPNPADEISNVSFILTKSSNVTITLTNMLGEEIMKSELGNVSAGENIYQLNTESINNGLYFVTVKTANGTVTKKAVINR